MNKPLVLFAIICVTAGCSSAIENQSKSGFLQDQGTSGVTCNDTSDCRVKWERAVQWVETNSFWPIKMQNDSTIVTRKPKAPYISRTRYVVDNLPLNDGRKLIKIQASCLPAVHCYQNPLIAIDSFNHFVNTGKALHLPNG